MGLVGLAAMLGVAGCPVVLVGAGAVGGYAVSRDRVDLTLERPYDQVWSACLEETKRMGLLRNVDEKVGRIEAVNQGAHLVVTLQRLTETTVKVTVRARKALLPKVELAQQLAARIAKRVG